MFSELVLVPDMIWVLFTFLFYTIILLIPEYRTLSKQAGLSAWIEKDVKVSKSFFTQRKNRVQNTVECNNSKTVLCTWLIKVQ